MTIKAQSRKH